MSVRRVGPAAPAWPVAAVDLHQHLWPEPLVDRLRARSRTPYLRAWTLHTHGEAPYEIDPVHHDVTRRLSENARDGIGLACLSLSAPLGIESLRGPSAVGLLNTWHEGAAGCPRVSGVGLRPSVEPDVDGLRSAPRRGFVGVQVPATDVRTPSGWARLARCSTSPNGPGSPCSSIRGRRRRFRTPPRCRSGGRRSSGTPPSCRPPGGRGTPPTSARPIRRCAWCSRPAPAWPRCTTSGTPPGAAAQARSTRSCTSTPRRTGRRASTRWCGCSGSTPSCWAATGRTPRRSLRALVTGRGEAAARAVRVTNPLRALGLPVRAKGCGMAAERADQERRRGLDSRRCQGAISSRLELEELVARPARDPDRWAHLVGFDDDERRLRLPASRRPRRRVAAVLDAGQRHRLARPRHLLGRRGRGRGRARREQPEGRVAVRGDEGARGRVVLVRRPTTSIASTAPSAARCRCTPTARRCGAWASTPSATTVCCAASRSPTQTSSARSTDRYPSHALNQRGDAPRVA